MHIIYYYNVFVFSYVKVYSIAMLYSLINNTFTIKIKDKFNLHNNK